MVCFGRTGQLLLAGFAVHLPMCPEKFVPKRLRRHARGLLEDLYEVALRRKREMIGDLDQGEIAVFEQIFCPIDFLFADIVAE